MAVLRVRVAGQLVDVGVPSNYTTTDTAQAITGLKTFSGLANSGLTGAVSASRYVGGTSSGAPTTGTFVPGDFVIAQDGRLWICTVAGSPGTWVAAAPVTSVAGRTGAVTLTAADVSAGNFPAGVYNVAQTGNTLPLQVGNGAGTGSGGYVQIGTTGTDSGYIGVEGTATNANLFVSAKGTGSIQISSAIASSRNISAPTFQGSGGTLGTTSGSRYVGATASVAPTTGTFLLGDFVITQTGHLYVCTAAGSPGTWTEVGSTLATALTVTGNIVTTGGSLTSSLANGGIELGSVSAANTPFIDFHSSGGNIDYDVRMIASAGSTSVVGQGSLAINAGAGVYVNGGLAVQNNSIRAQSTTASTGAVSMSPGSTTNAGYVEFFGTNGVRAGYIGNGSGAPGTTDTGTIGYQASTHAFTGAVQIIGVTQFSASGTNGPISVVYNGAVADNNGYGIVGITAPPSVNQAYYSMTAAGTAVWGMGLGTDNNMRLGTVNGSKTMSTAAVQINASGDVIAPGNMASVKFINVGTTGATTQTRWVGGTASVAPTTGTWAVGDFVISATGHLYVCTAAGTPGTWVDAGAGGGGGASLSVANTWTATQTHQTSDGSVPVKVSARLTGSGGQSGNLMEFRDAGNNLWTYVDPNGNVSSLVTFSASNFVAGNGLGSVGQMILNKPTSATSGTTVQPSTPLTFRTSYYVGGFASDEDLTLTGIRLTTGINGGAIQSSAPISIADIPGTPATLASQVTLYSASGRGKIKDGLGNVWNLDSSQLTRLTADVTSTSIVSPPVTSSTLASGTLGVGTYAYEINGAYRMSAAVGLALAVNFSSTQSAINQSGFIGTGPALSTNVVNFVNNTRVLGAAVTATATDYPFQLTGTVVVTASGTLTLNFGAQAAATATLRQGSYMRLTRIA